MNLIKKIALGASAFCLFILGDSFAQGGYFEDALRYSQHQSTGSARIMGISGTQVSLGGDVSNISGNPAGLGFFRRSEASFTGSYGSWSSETDFMGQIQENSKNNFALPNIGIVISNVKAPLELGDWRGGSFGISINRSRLYTNNFGYYSNLRGSNSLLDYYLVDYSTFGEPALRDPAGLPLDVGIIRQNDRGVFEKDPDYVIGNPFQDESVENEGSQTQITFAYGGNYKNKLFIGGALGVTSVNYLSTRTYNEEFLDEDDLNALYYSIQENLLQSGTGVNLNLGVIYKPQDNLNFGLSFRSPTWTRISEEFDADIFAEFYDRNGDLEFDESSRSNVYLTDFTLRSPLKLSAGGTFFFNKNGFVSADIDYLDYSTMYLSSQDMNLDGPNDDVKAFATSTINYRAGVEYRFDMFRIRAGAAFYGDPMGGDVDRSMIQYSGGVGARLANMYVDLGIIQSNYNTYYNSYPGASLATTGNKQLTGLLTLGFNF